MKTKLLAAAFTAAICAGFLPITHAGILGDSPNESSEKSEKSEKSDKGEKKSLDAILAKDADSKPTDTFPADIPKIWAFWRSTSLSKGDKVRAVWIAEDVGDVAPKETKIDEATLDAQGGQEGSAFSLSKPNKGWPIGTYRVEIYVEEDLAKTLKFTIEK